MSVPARHNEVKGAAIVCRHVFRHSLNTYFHCNTLKAAVIWQTETGKATCFAGVVCEELHYLLHMRCKWGESGQMCKGRCLSNTGAKTPLTFYHLTTSKFTLICRQIRVLPSILPCAVNIKSLPQGCK